MVLAMTISIVSIIVYKNDHKIVPIEISDSEFPVNLFSHCIFLERTEHVITQNTATSAATMNIVMYLSTAAMAASDPKKKIV